MNTQKPVKLTTATRGRLIVPMAIVAFCTAAACAATEPDFVTSDAVFWLDASALTETAGTELDSWADVRRAR